MSAPAPIYPMGLELIQRGACPLEAVNPITCWYCPYGHATECHHPMTCDEARCSHSEAAAAEDDFGLVVDPEDIEGAFDEPMASETDAQRQARYDQTAATFDESFPGGVEEFHRLERIAAGEERACAKCGCSETRACLGGCIWATETLCSRCV